MQSKMRMLAAFLVTSVLCSNLRAQSLIEVGAPDLIESIQLQVITERSKLHSGKVTGTGFESRESPIDSDAFKEIKTHLSLAFDDSQRAFYTQRSVPFVENFSGTWVARGYANISTSEATIVCGQKDRVPGSGRVSRLDTLLNPSKLFLGHGIGHAIDPRLIGVCTSGRLLRGEQFSPELLRNNLSTHGAAELLQTADESIVELRLTTEQTERCFFINQKRGYTVIRMTRRHRYEDVDNNTWNPFSEEHDIAWEAKGEIWVPTEFDLVQREEKVMDPTRLPKNAGERKYEVHKLHWSLKWLDVNIAIPASEFEESAIDIAALNGLEENAEP